MKAAFYIQRILDALEGLDPPDDWKPTDVGDEYIRKTFEIGWPADS